MIGTLKRVTMCACCIELPEWVCSLLVEEGIITPGGWADYTVCGYNTFDYMVARAQQLILPPIVQ